MTDKTEMTQNDQLKRLNLNQVKGYFLNELISHAFVFSLVFFGFNYISTFLCILGFVSIIKKTFITNPTNDTIPKTINTVGNPNLSPIVMKMTTLHAHINQFRNKDQRIVVLLPTPAMYSPIAGIKVPPFSAMNKAKNAMMLQNASNLCWITIRQIPIKKQHRLIPKFPTKSIFLGVIFLTYTIEMIPATSCTQVIINGTYWLNYKWKCAVTNPICEMYAFTPVIWWMKGISKVRKVLRWEGLGWRRFVCGRAIIYISFNLY